MHSPRLPAGLSAVLLAVLSAAQGAPAVEPPGGRGDLVAVGTRPLLVTSDRPGAVEDAGIRLFSRRLAERHGAKAAQVGQSEYRQAPSRAGSPFPVLVGVARDHALLADALERLGRKPPTAPEGYLLVLGKPDASLGTLLPGACGGYAIVCGTDERGVLYGLGRLLRLLQDGSRGPAAAPTIEVTNPATGERGVFLSTHFRNYYECAPMVEVESCIEECALWGSNTLYTLFGIGGYPENAAKDPDSHVSRQAARIRRMNEVARGLGMKVGFIGEANEGWTFYPELRAKASAQATRPFGTICPSKPAGMEMILRYRRAVCDLIGPIDEFCLWPYDAGGCGCAECSDAHGWTKTLLRIGPAIAAVVKERNPDARIVLSTWLMNDAERSQVYEECEKGTSWFQGLMMAAPVATSVRNPGLKGQGVGLAGERPVDPRYSLAVFPEISMFGCYFTSYGCNGANPAPKRFREEAARTAKLGYGAVLYSEGIYEDLNKCAWAATLWDPARTPEEVAAEYAGYYLGSANRKAGAELILGLEETWGSTKLAAAGMETVAGLARLADSLEAGVPKADWCRLRWLLLRYRARMDLLMARVGPDREVHREALVLFYAVRDRASWPGLRDRVKALHTKLQQRDRDLETLFDVYWEYLKRFHLHEVTLVFRPDELTGKVDYGDLLRATGAALKARNDESMREHLLKGYQRFFWSNSVDLGHF